MLISAFQVIGRCPESTQKQSLKGNCVVQTLGPSTYGNRMQEARMTNGTCAVSQTYSCPQNSPDAMYSGKRAELFGVYLPFLRYDKIYL